MQVKVFHSQSPAAIEDKINRWLTEAKPRISKVLQSQSTTAGYDGFGAPEAVSDITITILYLEEHEK